MVDQRRRARQVDVARLAGVSQATVSMVLNSSPSSGSRVSGAVRDRVLDAIAVTGYVANLSAQRLAGGRSSIIGVYTYEAVFPHTVGNFYQPFLAGVEEEAERAGVDLLLFTSMAARFGQSLTSTGGLARIRVADGCVLLGQHNFSEDLAEFLRQGFAFGFIGRRESLEGAVPYAAAAYDEATQHVVENLLVLGHRRIALVNARTSHEWIEDRARGYRTAMAAAGLTPVTYDATRLNLGELIDALNDADTTAVAANADIAGALRHAALDRGMSVPGELSIARLGDPEWPENEDVEWSGFLTPRREMGAQALRVVLRQLGEATVHPDELRVSVPCTFVPGVTAGAVNFSV